MKAVEHEVDNEVMDSIIMKLSETTGIDKVYRGTVLDGATNDSSCETLVVVTSRKMKNSFVSAVIERLSAKQSGT